MAGVVELKRIGKDLRVRDAVGFVGLDRNFAVIGNYGYIYELMAIALKKNMRGMMIDIYE